MFKFNRLLIVFIISLCGFANAKPYCAQKPKAEIISCLKAQIETHKPEILSYSDLLSILKEDLLTERQAQELIKYGYTSEVGNPILFLKAQKAIAPAQYSLNFLWIHKNRISEPGHLMGSNDQQLEKQVVSPLKDWQAKQPEANINFWYDGLLIDAKNVAQTEQHLQKNGLDLKNIRFRNIRDIPYVKENASLFAEAVPVYFRVDMAKAVTGDHLLRNEKNSFVVNIDSDIVAIVRTQLFDYPTLLALEKIGYAFGTAGTAEEENSFIMLHNSAETNTLEIHKKLVIDAADNEAQRLGFTKVPQQLVFDQYRNFRAKMRHAFREKTGKSWPSQKIQSTGKFMIFPASQFGVSGGYSEQQMMLLKKALLPASSQDEALMW